MNRCNQCGLPIINCICYESPRISTRAKFWVLSSEKELYRPTNTARLLKLVNPASTEIFVWERTKKPDELIRNINMENYTPYVLFPTENQEFDKRDKVVERTDKIPAFIILDGTWKEAKKIFRKSDYIKVLPTISIKPSSASRYDLRRGAIQDSLCTIEAAIEILRMNQEIKVADVIEDVYMVFLKRYKTGACGHSPLGSLRGKKEI